MQLVTSFRRIIMRVGLEWILEVNRMVFLLLFSRIDLLLSWSIIIDE
jgi:hypothetical protein